MSLQKSTFAPPAKRKLLIPHKRGLLPVSSLHKQQTTLLSPSTTRPAEIQFRRPVFSSVDENKNSKENKRAGEDDGLASVKGREEAVRIEFDSSQAPQPFLEPDVLERIRERQRQKEKDEQDKARQGAISTASTPGAGLNAEREIRRRAVQTEYGSMAVRGRMAVSGRGRRR